MRAEGYPTYPAQLPRVDAEGAFVHIDDLQPLRLGFAERISEPHLGGQLDRLLALSHDLLACHRPGHALPHESAGLSAAARREVEIRAEGFPDGVALGLLRRRSCEMGDHAVGVHLAVVLDEAKELQIRKGRSRGSLVHRSHRFGCRRLRLDDPFQPIGAVHVGQQQDVVVVGCLKRHHPCG